MYLSLKPPLLSLNFFFNNSIISDFRSHWLMVAAGAASTESLSDGGVLMASTIAELNPLICLVEEGGVKAAEAPKVREAIAEAAKAGIGGGALIFLVEGVIDSNIDAGTEGTLEKAPIALDDESCIECDIDGIPAKATV